jgi:hypothetical protein
VYAAPDLQIGQAAGSLTLDLVLWIPIVVSLALYFVPAVLFKRNRYLLSRDYLVSARGASDGVFQNSSLAYALQLATFGPFFVWGLSGDWIPGVWNSAFYCLGLLLLYTFRRQIADFLREALAQDRSITIHEFLARSHGGSPWIRVIASGLTVVALWGIVMAEMFGILAALGPMLGMGSEGSVIFVIGLFFLMFAYSTMGGNDGVMRTDQLQLGLAYIGVFTAVVGMIFLLTWSSQPGSPRAAMPILYFGIFGAMWLILRRFRFIEPPRSERAPNDSEAPRHIAWRVYLRFENVVNVLVVLVIVVMVFAAGSFVVVAGPQAVIEAMQRSVVTTTGMSGLALLALALLPLGYQIVDITNWQRFAAAGDPAHYAGGPGRSALLRYATEAPLVWISLLAFGALAAGLFDSLAGSQNPFGDYAAGLVALNNIVGTVTAVAFLVAVFAIGLSTMDAVFSATQCAFQYDLLPALERTSTGGMHMARKIRATRLFGLLTYLAVISMLYVVEKYLAFGRDDYLALLLAFYSAQMAFVPLVAGALIAVRRPGGQSLVPPKFAAGALIAGASVGIGATVTAIAGGAGELFLWGAIPACLLVSSVVYAAGWYVGGQITRERPG